MAAAASAASAASAPSAPARRPAVAFGVWNNGHVANMHMLALALHHIRPDVELHVATHPDGESTCRSIDIWQVFVMRDTSDADIDEWLQRHNFDCVVADFCTSILRPDTLPQCKFIASTNMAHWMVDESDTWSDTVGRAILGSACYLLAGTLKCHAFLGASAFPYLQHISAQEVWQKYRALFTGPWLRPALQGQRWCAPARPSPFTPLKIVLYLGGDSNEDGSLERMIRANVLQWRFPWLHSTTEIRSFGKVARPESRNLFDAAMLDCHLLISTAGAAVCAEISYLGVPTLLTTVDTISWYEQYMNATTAAKHVPWAMYASHDTLESAREVVSVCNGVRRCMEAAYDAVERNLPRRVENGVHHAADFLSLLVPTTTDRDEADEHLFHDAR